MNSQKSRLISLWLCFLLGIFGAHRFYLKKHLSAFFMLMTFGGLFLWTTIDFLLILFGLLKDGDGLKLKTWSKSYPMPKMVISIILMCTLSFGVKKGSEKIKIDKKELFSKFQIKKALPKKDTSNEIVKFIDDNGVTHFVNKPSKVPPEYIEEAQTNLKLPQLNKFDQ